MARAYASRREREDLQAGISSAYTSRYSTRPAPTASPIRSRSPPLGKIWKSISEQDLDIHSDLSDASLKIENCTDVASFNWLDEQRPTIIVPGSPPSWTPLKESRRLPQDSGEYFRDQNAARFPSHPLEPAVLSVLELQPDLNRSSVHLFACGSTPGNFLRFTRNVNKSFRMLVEVVDGTVFLTRRENSPKELIPDVVGHGHTFPDSYTSWDRDCRGSESHQRIIEYSFGGLKCLVRFEADGCLASTSTLSSEGRNVAGGPRTDNSVGSLLQGLSKNNITARAPTLDSLRIRRRGHTVPRSAIFDLKTRSIRKKDQDTLGEELPRMWVAQIPNFILAYHDHGKFEDISVRNVQKKIEDWEERNRAAIRKFAVLLHKIIDFARDKEGKFEIRRKDMGVLELREQGTGSQPALSARCKEKWTNGVSDGEDSLSDDDDNSDNSDDQGGYSGYDDYSYYRDDDDYNFHDDTY